MAYAQLHSIVIIRTRLLLSVVLKSNYARLSNKPKARVGEALRAVITNKFNQITSKCLVLSMKNLRCVLSEQLTSKWHERVKLPQNVSSVVIIIVEIILNDSIVDVVSSYWWQQWKRFTVIQATYTMIGGNHTEFQLFKLYYWQWVKWNFCSRRCQQRCYHRDKSWTLVSGRRSREWIATFLLLNWARSMAEQRENVNLIKSNSLVGESTLWINRQVIAWIQLVSVRHFTSKWFCIQRGTSSRADGDTFGAGKFNDFLVWSLLIKRVIRWNIDIGIEWKSHTYIGSSSGSNNQ